MGSRLIRVLAFLALFLVVAVGSCRASLAAPAPAAMPLPVADAPA